MWLADTWRVTGHVTYAEQWGSLHPSSSSFYSVSIATSVCSLSSPLHSCSPPTSSLPTSSPSHPPHSTYTNTTMASHAQYIRHKTLWGVPCQWHGFLLRGLASFSSHFSFRSLQHCYCDDSTPRLSRQWLLWCLLATRQPCTSCWPCDGLSSRKSWGRLSPHLDSLFAQICWK